MAWGNRIDDPESVPSKKPKLFSFFGKIASIGF
jgi:hypothetical protein